ncbi:hypothetical protein SSYIS1_16150 [Serratia symbiotica]|uniref:Uncharacterized protein n=1 Tax=Serratia symbiotica TaxID=138074 RepID=A0A455VMY8_9GAMM|nr:hypothetical protein SSYIS1_16150 [Serratia symbiotica]
MMLKSLVQVVGITKDIDANLAEKPFRLTTLIVPVSLE